jgi:hypothetical protein
MSQLYAKVFTQILDSSIAEDFTARHVFEDLFKICDYKTGVIDMTRQAISRRLNVPIKILNDSLSKLEAEDPNSRDPEFNGRRIEKLDEHRDWGWRILNWPKYEDLKNKADVALRVAKHRASEPSTPFKKPTLKELKEWGKENELPDKECEKFFHHYESNGWKVGKNPMRSWSSAMVNWRTNFQKGTYSNGTHQQNNSGGYQKLTGAQQRQLGIPEVQRTKPLSQLIAEKRKRESGNSLAENPPRP